MPVVAWVPIQQLFFTYRSEGAGKKKHASEMKVESGDEDRLWKVDRDRTCQTFRSIIFKDMTTFDA